MKKLNNKGFTLIEIVIVIVIIAILAAMLVPSLTQWINKSKMKTFTSACGTVRTSVASQLSEKFAADSKATSFACFTDADWQAIGNDVGKTVSNTTGADYVVSGTNVDNIKITDGAFEGEWNATAGTWDVTTK